MPTDRAIRWACQLVVVVWLATALGWRELAPREVRVAVQPTSVEAVALPPAPAAEPEEETEAETENAEAPEPAPPEIAEAPEPEPAEAPEPEPAPVDVAEAPEPEPIEAAEIPELAAAEEPEPLEAEPAPLEPAELPEADPAPLEVAEAPAPEPAPTLEAPLAAPPLPLQTVSEADVARGGTLLTGDEGFPVLESRYEAFGSFGDYARAMQALGARFVVVERHAILGTIDPWTLEAGTLADAAALSPRARDYAGEPALLAASRTVRRRHGNRAEIMMLVPRRIDAALFGGITRALEARGRAPGAYRQILARYERGPGGSLRLRVEAAVGKDGRKEPLPLLFDLSRLVRT